MTDEEWIENEPQADLNGKHKHDCVVWLKFLMNFETDLTWQICFYEFSS
jgi:hypothetical protein